MFFNQHRFYAVVTPKLIPVKLQVLRMCVSTQETYQSIPIADEQRWAGLLAGTLPGCSHADAKWVCWAVQGAGGFPPPGASLLVWGEGKSRVGPSQTGRCKRVCPRSGEAELICPPLDTCFLTSAAPLWAQDSTCFYEHGYCTCARLHCCSWKLPPRWDLLLRNNKRQAGSHTLFIFPGAVISF